MSVFIDHLRQQWVDQDDCAENIEAGDNYPNPVRTVTYVLEDGTQSDAPVVAATNEDAVDTFHKLAATDELIGDSEFEITDISPSDAELAVIKEQSDRLYRHLHRTRDRRDVEKIEEILTDAANQKRFYEDICPSELGSADEV